MSAEPRIRPIVAGLLAAAVLYLCFFSHLGALGFVGPDEPRYAEVAREMAESGDWVTPRLSGKPWFEKPVLYYWAAASAFRLFGTGEFAARLPSALAALATALVFARLAARLYGAQVGWAFVLLYPTCIGIFGFARAATTDMIFSASLALASACATFILFDEKWPAETGRYRGKPTPLRGADGGPASGTLSHSRSGLCKQAQLAGWGFFLGAATLTKGPAALALAAGSLGLWAITTRRWRDALGLARPAALAAFFATALPWYVLCAVRNAEFVDEFLVAHNIQRFFTPVFQHVKPFWFYGPILLVGLLPWTILLARLARAARTALRRRSMAGSAGFFFACCVAFPVLFFSFSQSKLPGYILPVLAPLVLLLARSTLRDGESEAGLSRWLTAGVGATFLVLALTASFWLAKLPSDSPVREAGQILPWLITASVAGVGVILLALRNQVFAAMVLSALLMAGLVEVTNRQFVPQLDARLSSRAAAQMLASRGGDAKDARVYHLHRAWHYGLNFYLHRELEEWASTAGPQPPNWLYTSEAGVAELERAGMRFEEIHRLSKQTILLKTKWAD